ncbi:methanogen output domain 1-containing protein [Fictibacillus aquaticus]|uniref:Fis family transcriptional regulator n=1 Tax=Fictibacillus aquaticus TaxID=2021314 RepID=A0A235F4N7_9BACL|nr:methanogen output domain 1-containing protein [Fictibacillus aquaticus]OYD56063.1 Fis family transcriptional regulator [Fictibacillus aquaticus]
MQHYKERINGQTFLAKLITQYAHIHKKTIGPAADEYIKQIGLRTGEWVESYYEKGSEVWTVDEYANIIVDLKNSIGGEFAISSVYDDHIVLKADSCPFGEMVKDSPHLCLMTSTVLGGIAARNFGYAKVTLRQRIALGHKGCEVAVYFQPDNREEGDEYKDIPITPKNGDPFAWEEETIAMMNQELQKSDAMIQSLLQELEELQAQVKKQG